MEFLKHFGHGLKDVYDSFWFSMVASLLFWVACAPMLLGYGFLSMGPLLTPLFFVSAILVPPALTTLFAAMDPRRVVNRMDLRDALQLMRSSFWRSWKIGLITLLPLMILAWNIGFFAGTGLVLEVLVPLWFVMWFFLFVISFYCFSLAGTQESGWRNAFRGGLFMLVKRPGWSLTLGALFLLIGYMLVLSVVPMLLIGPAIFASITNRVVFAIFGVEVIDPDSPTIERADERERGVNLEPSLVDKVLRRDGR